MDTPDEDPIGKPSLRSRRRLSADEPQSAKKLGDPATARLRRISTSMGAEMKEEHMDDEEVRDRMGVGMDIRRPPPAKTRRSSLARLWSEEKHATTETRHVV